MTHKITDQLISYVASVQANKQASPKTKKDLAYEAVMLMYLTKVHESVMDAWKKFGETTDQIAEDSNTSHRARQLRQAELEGQRRQFEFLKQGEGNYVHRQAAAFHSLEKASESLSHRHLYQTV